MFGRKQVTDWLEYHVIITPVVDEVLLRLNHAEMQCTALTTVQDTVCEKGFSFLTSVTHTPHPLPDTPLPYCIAFRTRVAALRGCDLMLACAQYQPGYSNGGMPSSMANPRPKINPEQVRDDAWTAVTTFSAALGVCCGGDLIHGSSWPASSDFAHSTGRPVS